MSEREKEKQDNEGLVLHHFHHQHPLTLSVVGGRSRRCYGCWRFIYPRETAYICSVDCGHPIRLHQDCAEMPREITLSSHPQHTLIQKEVPRVPKCAVCEIIIYRIGYYCSSSDSCNFQIHVGCALDINVAKTCITHPSHSHQLTLLRRSRQSCSFKCDACGIIQKGNSYICSDCQYWIHESCATLPPTRDFHHLHHHALSLAYHVPLAYLRFDFKCCICFKDLLPKYWVYHCQTCRYVVHFNCAIHSDVHNTNANAAEDEGVIAFPTNNAGEELIGSFVTNGRGVQQAIPNDEKYKFHNHDHHLRLISSALHDQEEELVNDEDDEFHYGKKSKLVCDGCTMPISQKKYISCGQCKYFLHLACFQLPIELPFHPLHPKPDHNLTLQTTPILFTRCYICWFFVNGLLYKCTKCSFQVDVKCASLPNTIKHAAHPNHHLKLLNEADTRNDNYGGRFCEACGVGTYADACYMCDICEIIFHSSCCLLPAAVTNPTWDKHPLPLTFYPSIDHPSSFYCDVCEQEMNPKSWMYHCHHCDVSIHPKCLPTASGKYRNIKFGQRYLVDAVHNHPLAFQLLTKKLYCDVCRERNKYGQPGFQCCSEKCEFFMCLEPCGEDHEDALHAVD